MPIRLVALSLALLTLRPAAQQPAPGPADGVILSQAPCEFTPYEQSTEFARRYYSRQAFDAASRSTTVDCTRIRYASGGLAVVGFIVKPRTTVGQRLPVIVFNRGGYGDIGKIETWNLVDFYGFASQGFVVLASQYRGNDGGEGHDEVGGADVADVMSLAQTAAALPYADAGRLYLYGLSRGGMMSFLALKQGFRAKAVAAVGAVYDFEAAGRRTPKIVASALAAVPEANRGAVLRERSVVNWPNQVTAPLLIIHGTADQEVPVAEALSFAAKLSQLGKPYELVVYADDIHEAANNRQDRDAKIVEWFKQHR
jgi:dipeptidyl aminopeptidase/acylaminoacyl peptidase